MAALQRGEIDLYPEYTGTALLVVLKAAAARRRRADLQLREDANTNGASRARGSIRRR